MGIDIGRIIALRYISLFSIHFIFLDAKRVEGNNIFERSPISRSEPYTMSTRNWEIVTTLFVRSCQIITVSPIITRSYSISSDDTSTLFVRLLFYVKRDSAKCCFPTLCEDIHSNHSLHKADRRLLIPQAMIAKCKLGKWGKSPVRLGSPWRLAGRVDLSPPPSCTRVNKRLVMVIAQNWAISQYKTRKTAVPSLTSHSHGYYFGIHDHVC